MLFRNAATASAQIRGSLLQFSPCSGHFRSQRRHVGRRPSPEAQRQLTVNSALSRWCAEQARKGRLLSTNRRRGALQSRGMILLSVRQTKWPSAVTASAQMRGKRFPPGRDTAEYYDDSRRAGRYYRISPVGKSIPMLPSGGQCHL